jgi:DNA-binding phage protein
MVEEKMTKRMTSKKQDFSLNDIPISKLKTGVKTRKVNSGNRLKDQELVFKAFWQCLVDQDIESFKEILRGHLEAVNKAQFAKKSKTSRRTLHRILSPEGNPTLKNISSVIHALYG